MTAEQDKWGEKLKGVGLTPSTADSYAYTDLMDVPCPQLSGIKAKFVLAGEGVEGIEPGVYLVVGIHQVGVTRYPLIRDAITAFARNVLQDSNKKQQTSSSGPDVSQGIQFDVVGMTETEATILRLRTPDPERYKNIGTLVETFGAKAIRVHRLGENEFTPPTE